MLDKFLNNRFLVLYVSPFILGSLSTLTFQPFNFTIINFLILPLFFYLIVYIKDKSKGTYRKKPFKKNLFLFGLLFGFGFYLSGISWITNSLTFDQSFKILIPFALIVIPLFLGLFFGLTTMIIGPYLKLNIMSLIFFSGGLAFSDYLRSKLFTGFPWNLWAYSMSWSTEILQILNLLGLHIFNLFIITLFTLPAIVFFRISLFKKLLSFFFISLIILSFYIYGDYKINNNKKILNLIDDKIYVKVVSPNFDLKYNLYREEKEI